MLAIIPIIIGDDTWWELDLSPLRIDFHFSPISK